MDVLLINPTNIASRPFGIMPPLALALLGNVLEKAGFSVKILDLEIRPEDFNLKGYISTLNPRIIGIGGTTHSRFESFRIARLAKEVSGDIFTVYGGCHASFTAQDTLLHIREIDYIVRGEGERVFLELVSCLISGKGSLENILGVSFRKANEIIHNPSQGRIKDLDSITYSRHLLEMDKYEVILEEANLPATTILTSRGCPFNCSFCSASAMFGREYYMRSAESVVREIDECVQLYKIKAVRFFDSTLTLNRGHINSLVDGLKKRKNKLPWHCELRVNTVDRALLKAMKESGCYSVDFGVESASPNVLKIIGKDNIPEYAVRVLKWCKELGIRVVVFFSFGHIAETWEDSQKTLAFIDKYYSYMSTAPIFGIRVYPGTAVEKYAFENHLLPEDFSWSKPFTNIKEGPILTDNVPYLLQPQYGIQELQRAYYEMQKLDSRKFFGFKAILGKFQEIHSFADLMQKTGTMFKLMKKSVSGR